MSPSAVTPTSKGFPGLLDIVQGFGNPLQKTFTYRINGTAVNRCPVRLLVGVSNA